MAKYNQVFKEMIEYNKDLFDSFRLLHQKYSLDPSSYQSEFNTEGEKVLRVIRRYENILCGKSESGKFGKFSSTLSDKFWQQVREFLPLIDKVGLAS
ncbi:hypothetical protein BH09PAT1_BH09PAT1_6780 [soil metagenome]